MIFILRVYLLYFSTTCKWMAEDLLNLKKLIQILKNLVRKLIGDIIVLKIIM